MAKSSVDKLIDNPVIVCSGDCENSVKPPLSLELLEKLGIPSNHVDNAISTLEKIFQFVQSKKCDWVNREKNQRLERLKWAAKKFVTAINGQDVETKETKETNEKLNRIASRSISRKSGICRLRNQKGQKYMKLYHGEKGQVRIPALLKSDRLNLEPEFRENDEESTSPNYPNPKKCYICEENFTKVHNFYDQLCTSCGDFNFSKRSQTADLSGKVALVTGGRIKIGYEVVLKLLRSGISLVITTTRFPQDASKRYANEPDYENWKDRLHIYGLDLRFLGNVEKFCKHVVKTYTRLDILIQNAAQTIRRPPAFYAHLIRDETLQISNGSPLIRTFDSTVNNLLTFSESTNSIVKIDQNSFFSPSALSSQLEIHPDDSRPENSILFPVGQYDRDHQQVDLRMRNSWMLETPEVETTEVVEVSIVNYIAPFAILSKLTPLLKKTSNSTNNAWVILVSAMEGQFYRPKSSRHPHTNCSKASLNMLARTSGSYYAKFNILVNSVDPGWVTDEVPTLLRQKKGKTKEFIPPLDEVDGAARILDPIFQTINHGVTESGLFFKDYRETVW